MCDARAMGNHLAFASPALLRGTAAVAQLGRLLSARGARAARAAMPAMPERSAARVRAREALLQIGAVARTAQARGAGQSGGALRADEISAVVNALDAVDASALSVYPNSFGGLGRRIGYVAVRECAAATLAVFVLPAGGRIPLHDHPNMTVFSKVLWGKLRVDSFDSLGDERVARTPSAVLAAGETRVLTPIEGNFHSFSAAADEPVAVLDVVVPPYDNAHGRPCTYYAYEDAPVGVPVLLREIVPPADFETIMFPYKGMRVPL